MDMPDLDPTLIVLLYASIAALSAAIGVVPHALRGELPRAFLGWANALAAGLMLGVAYALLSEGLGQRALPGAGGAILGVAFVRITHWAAGTQDLDLNELDELAPEYGYQVVLVHSLHGAYEGVAIGAAMVVALPFGISMALALAVHNISEAMVLTAILSRRSVRTLHAAGLAVATNVNQVLVAVVTFVLVGALPALFPWALGFAVGALIYLVLSDLLPESYRQSGHTTIAVVTLVAMGIVILLGGTP